MKNSIAYSIEETCSITGVGRTILYQELNAGKLKAVKIGRRTLIMRTDIEDWLKSAELYSCDSKRGV